MNAMEPGHSRTDVRAFSLVELMAVVAIIALLMALAVPSLGNLIRATEITQGADQLQAAFSQARQIAIARNRTVELRIYRYRDPSQPSDPETGRFRAVQSFVMESTPESTIRQPVSRILRLPRSVYLSCSKNLELSSLLNPARVPQTSGAELKHPISPVELNYMAARIQFFPDGSSNLDVRAKAFLTIVPATTADDTGSPPANFATLLVQPLSGKTRIFRP